MGPNRFTVQIRNEFGPSGAFPNLPTDFGLCCMAQGKLGLGFSTRMGMERCGNQDVNPRFGGLRDPCRHLARLGPRILASGELLSSEPQYASGDKDKAQDGHSSHRDQ